MSHAARTDESRDTFVESRTEWRRCIRFLIFIEDFVQKSSVINGFFAERDLRHIRMRHVTQSSSHEQNGEDAHNVLSL